MYVLVAQRSRGHIKLHSTPCQQSKHVPPLVCVAEECAYKVLTNLNKDGVEEPGIPYITEAYYKHRDNAEVVENICVLFMELCDYSESASRCNTVSECQPAVVQCVCCAVTSHQCVYLLFQLRSRPRFDTCALARPS